MKLSPKQKEVIRLMRKTHPRMGYFISGNTYYCSVYAPDFHTPHIRVHWGSCKSLIKKKIVEEKRVNDSYDYYLTELGKTIEL